MPPRISHKISIVFLVLFLMIVSCVLKHLSISLPEVLLENLPGFLNSKWFLLNFFMRILKNFIKSFSRYYQSPSQDFSEVPSGLYPKKVLWDFFQDLSRDPCRSFHRDISQIFSWTFSKSFSRDSVWMIFCDSLWNEFPQEVFRKWIFYRSSFRNSFQKLSLCCSLSS